MCAYTYERDTIINMRVYIYDPDTKISSLFLYRRPSTYMTIYIHIHTAKMSADLVLFSLSSCRQIQCSGRVELSKKIIIEVSASVNLHSKLLSRIYMCIDI